MYNMFDVLSLAEIIAKFFKFLRVATCQAIIKQLFKVENIQDINEEILENFAKNKKKMAKLKTLNEDLFFNLQAYKEDKFLEMCRKGEISSDYTMYFTSFIDFRKTKTIGSLIYKIAKTCWKISGIKLPSFFNCDEYKKEKKKQKKQ